jgi:hypothetical protein
MEAHSPAHAVRPPVLLACGLVASCVISCHAFTVNMKSAGALCRQRLVWCQPSMFG